MKASKGAKIASLAGNAAADLIMPEMAPITEQVITPENLQYAEDIKSSALDGLAHSAGLTADEDGLGWLPLLGFAYWDVIMPLQTVFKQIMGILEDYDSVLRLKLPAIQTPTGGGGGSAYETGQQVLDIARVGVLNPGVVGNKELSTRNMTLAYENLERLEGGRF